MIGYHENPHQQTNNSGFHPESMNSKKILLVEDDTDLREMVGEILESAGYATVHASNQEEAFKALGGEKPDLVLLDVMLPDGNGLDICRLIRGEENTGNRPVVFVLSGETSMDCRLKSYLYGAKRFFSKPFDPDELIDSVNKVMGNDKNCEVH